MQFTCKKTWMVLLMATLFVSLYGQSQYVLTLRVSSTTGDNLSGSEVFIEHIEYGLIYKGLLNQDGQYSCTLAAAGKHLIRISKEGFKTHQDTVDIQASQLIDILMEEEVRQPYALYTEVDYNPSNGKSSVFFNWNKERDYFFDDFETYAPFLIEFSPWSGKDVDQRQAAVLQGSYPNRGMLQYATIFNPLTIDPPVWYSYPVLRPYSGSQYVGFIRTQTGEANNDWLISPKIKVGVKNVVRFMAKAGDATKEVFKVYISQTDTELSHFKPLSTKTQEEVDYKSWAKMEYDLTAYEGKEVYIAIQYTSQASFMLMIDDFYLGPQEIDPSISKRKQRSAGNPYERFELFADGNSLGETTETSFVVEGLTAGHHTLGVMSKYRVAQSDTSTTIVAIENENSFASIQITVSANGGDPNGLPVVFTHRESGTEYTSVIENFQAGFGFLRKGDYIINILNERYNDADTTLSLTENTALNIALTEKIVTPYNLIWDEKYDPTTEKSDITLKWNQDLGWQDGFESYGDFAQTFGEWLSIDLDHLQGYKINFKGSDVTFPGSGGPLPGIVFNAYTTTPSMSADPGMIAPEGKKCIVFISPERSQGNDWLISPKKKIESDYILRFWAKSYEETYPETLRIGISSNNDPAGFELLDELTLSSDWIEYEVDLTDYAGKKQHIAFNYYSYDKFICSLDNVYIGPRETQANAPEGVLHYNVYLNDVKQDSTSAFQYDFKSLPQGTYRVGIEAQYESGLSPIASLTIETGSTGVENRQLQPISLYQNNNQWILSNPENKPFHYTIYNSVGQNIGQGSSQTTSTPLLLAEKGVYMIIIDSEGLAIRHKAIVQ